MKTTLLFLSLALAACTQAPTTTPVSFDAPAAAPAAGKNGMQVLHGTVQDVRFNEFGRPEGMVLQAGDQSRFVVFPGALVSQLGTALSKGKDVDVVVAPIFVNAGEQATYRLICLRDDKGRYYAAFNPSRDRFVHVDGVIQTIIADDAGVPTAVRLNTGDVVAVSPRQAKQHAIAVGDTFAADGHAVPSPTGGLYVDAQDVNGVAMRVFLPPSGWGVRVVSDEYDGTGDGSEYDMEGGDMGGFIFFGE